MLKLHRYSPNEIQNLIKIRSNETKLGERVHIGNLEGKYIILGIPESVGVKANGGIGGTETLWNVFLSSFLNIQSTYKLEGSEISILGFLSPSLRERGLRGEVEEIDEAVSELISKIVAQNKIPIVIGGGHNNAYPILKGVSLAKNQAINAINLDAHSDFRFMEGRHSGNGFRYAMAEGYLGNYAMVSLHENYNAQNIIDELLANPNIHFSFYEDIFIREKLDFKEAVNQAINFTKNTFTGIELDLDAIANTLSSAITPCGISTVQARQYLYQTAQNCSVSYLHIAEGATELENGLKNILTGKLVSYLVSDFLKAIIEIA